MGNVPSQPTLGNLPKPRDEDLLNFLVAQGFVFAEPLDNGLTHSVTSPVEWCLLNVSESTYSDYVNLHLISPLGEVISSISGKFTSYDSHCHMYDMRREKKTVDLTKGKVVNGFFQDDRAVYQSHIKEYKALCRRFQGYPEKQGQCDQVYNILEQEAKDLAFEFNVHRIVLGSDPAVGGLQAMASLATGTD
jgi:hypothetical protein